MTKTNEIRNIEIDDLVIDDDAIQIRGGTVAQTVERYRESLDLLPAVDVFEIDGKEDGEKDLILADGFHRIAAAVAEGRSHFNARIHTGTREDAAEFAAVANATSGEPLTIPERNDAIRRIHRMHPRMKQSDVAAMLSVSQTTISNVYRIDAFRASNKKAGDLSDAHVSEILGAKTGRGKEADANLQSKLASTAVAQEWTRSQVRAAVANQRDMRIKPEDRKRVLRGEIRPIAVPADGEYATVSTSSTAAQAAATTRAPSVASVWTGVRNAMQGLTLTDASDTADAVNEETAFVLADATEVDGFVDWLIEFRAAIAATPEVPDATPAA